MSKIIVVANQKGGVGKTTTAVNLSSALALRHKKVLVVDLDPQGNASMGLGVNKNAQKHTIYDGLMGRASFSEVCIKSSLNTLDIIPSNKHLSAATLELANEVSRETKLKEFLEPLKSAYDVILIDSPPALSLLTINGFVAADFLLIPMQCEYFALEGLADLLDSIKRIKNSGVNRNLKILGLLRVMFDRRSSLSIQVSGELDKHFGDLVLQTVIPRNVRLAEAPSFGQSAVLFDSAAAGSKAYMNLATEILSKLID